MKLLKKLALRRLERKLAHAVQLGVLTANESAEILDEARAVDWMMIIQIFMMLLEMIQEFLENR